MISILIYENERGQIFFIKKEIEKEICNNKKENNNKENDNKMYFKIDIIIYVSKI